MSVPLAGEARKRLATITAIARVDASTPVAALDRSHTGRAARSEPRTPGGEFRALQPHRIARLLESGRPQRYFLFNLTDLFLTCAFFHF